MEIKVKGIISDKVDVVISMNDIIEAINAMPMWIRIDYIKRILDEVRISDLDRDQELYFTNELKKLTK